MLRLPHHTNTVNPSQGECNLTQPHPTEAALETRRTGCALTHVHDREHVAGTSASLRCLYFRQDVCAHPTTLFGCSSRIAPDNAMSSTTRALLLLLLVPLAARVRGDGSDSRNGAATDVRSHDLLRFPSAPSAFPSLSTPSSHTLDTHPSTTNPNTHPAPLRPAPPPAHSSSSSATAGQRGPTSTSPRTARARRW